MNIAYVDASVVAAIALREPNATQCATTLASFDQLISSNLLEAELLATLFRESAPFAVHLTQSIGWIYPTRQLSGEFETVLAAGYLRGADLMHVATALYTAPAPAELSFATLDRRQGEVAGKVGFPLVALPVAT